MALSRTITSLVAVLLTSAVAVHCFRDYTPDQIPKPRPGWWGRGNGTGYVENVSIRPFKVSVDRPTLIGLRARLAATIYPEPLEGATFDYGFNSKYLKTVVDYWKDKYNWYSEQARINSFPQYKTQIEGIDVHFLHARPKNVTANVTVVPLLISHGWPSSFVEFLDIVPLLTAQRPGLNFVFEVIAPSIPGFGFSEAPHQKGFGQVAAAQVFDKLMQRLGFQSYYVQGGDWGSFISNHLAILYPERVKGMHVNAVSLCNLCGKFKGLATTFSPPIPEGASDAAKSYIMAVYGGALNELGFFHLQASKPDTAGLAVANSPAGMAAYILEKVSGATNNKGVFAADGLLTKKFTMTQLITNLMVYWVTGTVTSSMRFYKEHFTPDEDSYNIETMMIKTPSAVAAFPNEFVMVPEVQARERLVNLVAYTKMPQGGHFAAQEEPQLLADDIYSFVDKVQNK